MKEKPILFNTSMVQAILAGQKTVTRRPIKTTHRNAVGFNVVKNGYGEIIGVIDYDEDGAMFENYSKPPYLVDDVLYVRETWARHGNPKVGRPMHYDYRADRENPNYFDNGFIAEWRPSIHMPKEAARLWLKVTDVSIERLQDITAEECRKEGIYDNYKTLTDEYHDFLMRKAYPETFAKLWNSTIKKNELLTYGWEANPWIWRIEFEGIEK